MAFPPVSELIESFFGLIYPNICVCCSRTLLRGEHYLCAHCMYDLPVTGFYRYADNPVEQIFWGRVRVERAVAHYFFRKGNRIQTLVHQMKYHGQKEIGELLGKEIGKALRKSPLADVDMVLPVPLHPDKLRKRGYNQSEWIARGICAEIHKPLNVTSLIRRSSAGTQTKKKRYERWENVEKGFGLSHPDALAGKYVLLVDDVLTTGATLEACIHAVQRSADTKVGIAALAWASD